MTTRFFLTCLLLLATTACSSPVSRTYRLTFVSPVISHAELTEASMRMIRARLEGFDVKPEDLRASLAGSGALISLTFPDAELADLITEELIKPFWMRVMVESSEAEAAVVLPTHGGFKESGIDERHLTFASVGASEEPGRASLGLGFNDEGHRLLKQLGQEQAGKKMALFVKDRLLSLFVIDASFGNDIVIDAAPSPAHAQVVADDVNVGLYVRFAPTTEQLPPAPASSSASSLSSPAPSSVPAA